jgi:serine phosphatase RsbU (regulator of sigma subunit)
MFNKLAIKLSFFLAIILSIILIIFSIFHIKSESSKLKTYILEKGSTYAQTGALIISQTLDNVIDNELFTLQEVTNFELVPIELPLDFINKYKTNKKYQAKYTVKYHYKTRFDSFLDNTILHIQDNFLNDSTIEYSVSSDKNGYIPVHNSRYNKLLTGDYHQDLKNNRTKRIFFDAVAQNLSKNTTHKILKQEYLRDTGEILWDISSPIYVKGYHWGSFRVGISITKAYSDIHMLQYKLFVLFFILLIISIFFIYQTTNYFLAPLQRLHLRIKRVGQGRLSVRQMNFPNDEIGSLAKAFDKMTQNLREHIAELEKTTAEREHIQGELNVAQSIQNNMLQSIFPPFPDQKDNFDIFALLKAAKEVGGDFYDFHLSKNNKTLFFCIGDVSGKGVPASLFMAVTLTLLKSASDRFSAPDKIVTVVNQALCKDNENQMFVTIFYGALNLETGKLSYCSAGHNPPYIINKTGKVTELPITNGMAAGIDPDFKYILKSIQLKLKDVLFTYTDGVTEAKNNKNSFYGEENLINQLAKYKGLSTEDIVNREYNNLVSFANNAPQADDITMMAIQFTKKL